MLITKIYDRINRNYIISDHLGQVELEGYVDKVIDNINDRMQTKFPVISEWADYVNVYNTSMADTEGFIPLDPANYTAIPDKYIRSVILPGAAVAFYTTDEEGEQTSSRFFIEYEQNLGYMIRDYIVEVPEQYQSLTGGYIESDLGIRAKEVDNYGDFFL